MKTEKLLGRMQKEKKTIKLASSAAARLVLDKRSVVSSPPDLDTLAWREETVFPPPPAPSISASALCTSSVEILCKNTTTKCSLHPLTVSTQRLATASKICHIRLFSWYKQHKEEV